MSGVIFASRCSIVRGRAWAGGWAVPAKCMGPSARKKRGPQDDNEVGRCRRKAGSTLRVGMTRAFSHFCGFFALRRSFFRVLLRRLLFCRSFSCARSFAFLLLRLLFCLRSSVFVLSVDFRLQILESDRRLKRRKSAICNQQSEIFLAAESTNSLFEFQGHEFGGGRTCVGQVSREP